jgi:hypothetical protein
MASTSPFPPYPHPRLGLQEVVDYLLHAKANGWCEVYQASRPNEFVLVLGPHEEILIAFEHGQCLIVSSYYGRARAAGKPRTLPELEDAIDQAAAYCFKPWPAKMTTARLSDSTPAANKVTISRLLGSAEIQGVFDPYLDNQALATLLDIVSLGGSISNAVRLLSSTEMTQGRIPRLTKTFISSWFAERGITAGETRLMPKGEHRRFMLLRGGQSLIVGMSLNAIAKNEAAHLERDDQDRAFFDSVWATATPL